jgi:hypothetical protein
MELEASHKTGHGLFFQANYTWAHNISDAQGDAPNGFQGETRYGLADLDRFDIGLNRGNVVGARRQRFLLTGAYELPFGEGRRWSSSSHLLSGVLGGWSLNTVTLLESGPYLTPTISPTLDQTNTNPVADGSIVRPDLIGNPISAYRTSNNYFNLPDHPIIEDVGMKLNLTRAALLSGCLLAAPWSVPAQQPTVGNPEPIRSLSLHSIETASTPEEHLLNSWTDFA